MRRPSLLAPSSARALGAAPRLAQSPRVAAREADALPACGEQGIRRVAADIHVPLAVDSDWSARERRVQVRVAPSARPR